MGSGINPVHHQTPPNHLGERLPLHASNPLLTRGLMGQEIGGPSTEPNDLGSGDSGGNVSPELAVRLSADSAADGNKSPIIDDLGSELDIVTDNPPLVGSSLRPLASDLTPVRLLGCWVFSF